ncbi:hypothetical protein J2T17_006360 [Paenibacillus mucilaginosus]|uniref:hypothetical protein n=1 Tax=Paenibacillus mucilaginosus TaxID=61624 RepID=UPI003D215494
MKLREDLSKSKLRHRGDLPGVYKFKSIGDMNEQEKALFAKLLYYWHTDGIHLECLCKDIGPFPKLHVRESSAGKLYLSNNPGTNRGDRAHNFQCELNLPEEGYKGYLRQKGIDISEDGEITCNLKKPDKRKAAEDPQEAKIGGKTKNSSGSTPAAGENALRFLFLTLLQESRPGVHVYSPGRRREIHKRLYYTLKKTKLNKVKLNDSDFYIASSRARYNFNKHRIAIFWGDKFAHPAVDSPSNTFTVNLPVFSIADPSEKLQDISILKSVYEAATLTGRAVGTGYWVLYREENKAGKLIDTELIFEPAEPVTGIPVESSYEAQMIRRLVSEKREFKKPLIGNVTELFLAHRPDMVLLDTNPETIIEVAGFEDDDYQTRLASKREKYLERGYRYFQWDVKIPLEQLVLPPMK